VRDSKAEESNFSNLNFLLEIGSVHIVRSFKSFQSVVWKDNAKFSSRIRAL